jgi:hypothetical protein
MDLPLRISSDGSRQVMAGVPLSQATQGSANSGQSIFREAWWLNAAAGDRWLTIEAESGSSQRAFLNVFRSHKFGLPALLMPPLTRTLGPVFEGMTGKPETIRRMRLNLIGEIIGKLPPHVIFNHALEPTDNDALAWRLHGFSVNVEYTFRLEDCSDLDRIFAGVRDTTRRVIRRAQDRLSIGTNRMSPAEFMDFYFKNLRLRKERANIERDVATRVLEAARAHDALAILCARDTDDEVVASICTVFDRHSMFYLMTTHNPSAKDNGAVAMLVWRAICRAAECGLAFDFDGFGDRGTAFFLSQFGGTLCHRLRVNRMPKLLQAIMHLGPRYTNQHWYDRTF